MGDLADYYEALEVAHAVVQPNVYLEIGVHEGHSFRLARGAAVAVGVDPVMDLRFPAPPGARTFRETSDEFFARDAAVTFEGTPVDLTFVDGLHHWDQALRDVLHAEQHSHEDGCVLVHDCLPIDAETSTRDRNTVVWSGDVWKVVVWLRRHRPDLEVTTIAVEPTGLAVIRGLDPRRPLVKASELDEDLWLLGYDDVADSLGELLNVVPATVARLERSLTTGAPGSSHRGRAGASG